MLRDDPGVVLELHVVQSRDVYENRKPWNRGTLFAKDWQRVGRDAEILRALRRRGLRRVSASGAEDVPAEQRRLERVAAGSAAELSGVAGVGGRAGGVSSVRGSLNEISRRPSPPSAPPCAALVIVERAARFFERHATPHHRPDLLLARAAAADPRAPRRRRRGRTGSCPCGGSPAGRLSKYASITPTIEKLPGQVGRSGAAGHAVLRVVGEADAEVATLARDAAPRLLDEVAAGEIADDVGADLPGVIEHRADEVLLACGRSRARRRDRVQSFVFAALPAVASTRAPFATPSWIAAVPSPLAPACTSSVSPASSRPRRKSARCVVWNGSRKAAASASSSPSGASKIGRRAARSRTRRGRPAPSA